MKVLSIVSSLDPARGGTQAGATNMVLATQRAGVHNVLVAAGTPAARRRAHAFTAPLREEGVRVKQFASLPWPPEHPDRWGLSVPQMRWVARNVEEFLFSAASQQRGYVARAWSSPRTSPSRPSMWTTPGVSFGGDRSWSLKRPTFAGPISSC
jgi:hypothetical protein